MAEFNRESTVTSSPEETSVSATDTSGAIKLIAERLNNYRTAHESAVKSGESSKVRRLDRGIKASIFMVITSCNMGSAHPTVKKGALRAEEGLPQ